MVMSVLVLAACSDPGTAGEPEPPTREFPNWPSLFDGLRFRWTAEPGIDLLTGPGVPLRAFVESFRIGASTYDPDSDSPPPKFQTYPGFHNAVAHPPGGPSSSPHQIRYAWPIHGSAYNLEPLFGNEYLHVLQLDSIENGYRAYVCDGRYNVFRHDTEADKYVSIVNAYTTINLWRVELTHTPPLPPPGPPQEGPNPAPLDDQFGKWGIAATDDASWGWEDRPNPPDDAPDQWVLYRECFDKMPVPEPDMQATVRLRLDAPPDFEPAVPGWPADPN